MFVIIQVLGYSGTEMPISKLISTGHGNSSLTQSPLQCKYSINNLKLLLKINSCALNVTPSSSECPKYGFPFLGQESQIMTPADSTYLCRYFLGIPALWRLFS